MNKLTLLAALISLPGAVGLSGLAMAADPTAPAPAAAPAPPAPAQVKPLPDPVAVVNGVPISKAFFEGYAQQRRQRGGDLSTPEARQALLDEVVYQELLFQEAAKQKLSEDPQVKQQMEMVSRNLLASAAVRKWVEANKPGDEDIKKGYEAAKAAMGDQKEYKARHILVDSEDQAKEIITQLDKGGDFAALAKEKSSDSSKDEGGDLGWFSADMMVPAFVEAAQALEKGKYTKQPVKTDFGWHVILLEDTRTAEPPSLESIRPQLMQQLQQQKIQAYLESIKQGAKIEIK